MNHKRIYFVFIAIYLVVPISMAQQTPLLSIRLSPDEGEAIVSVDISADEKYILTGSRIPILWDAERGEKMRVYPGHEEFDILQDVPLTVLSAKISSNQKMIVTGDRFNNIVISDLESGKSVMKVRSTNVEPLGDGIVGAAILPDHKRVLSAHSDGELELWDIESGELIRKYMNRGNLYTMNLLNGGYEAVLGHQTLSLIDLETDEIKSLSIGGTPSFSADETVIQFMGTSPIYGRVLKQWSLITNEEIHEIAFPNLVAFLTHDISPDVRYALFTILERINDVRGVSKRILYDVVSSKVIWEYTLDTRGASNSPNSVDQIIKFFPSEKKFMTVNGNAVHIWNISDVAASVEDAGLHLN